MTAAPVLPTAFDPTDPVLNEEAIPLQEFLELRRTAPVHWVEQAPEARAGFLDTGFWAITKHADILAVSKNSKEFSANENGVIIRFGPDMTREQVELQGVMLVNQDPPDHTKLRQIISRGFTPRSINALHEVLIERANKIVDDALAKGAGDFVFEVAAELPLQAIAELLGVPQEDRRKLFDWSNQMLAYDDPEYNADPETAAAEILGYSMALAEQRKADPKDDIISKLVTAGEDGEGLTDDEFGFFVILLAVAGNETTRNAITHGMHAFFQNPEQWDTWKKERPSTMVDEVIRWATPVTVFQRTALNDVEISGQLIKKGERVALYYASGNHDEDVFADAGTFDIKRDPNPHLAFGGHGAHYCIGANLARLEVDVMFNVIADRMPNIKQAGEPRRLRHAWINGIKELPVKYS
ncbi:cytochrome P450 [Nocardioides marmoriginsengisoli]|uniref:Cytochrome P450 n=1 Tax=Nocardioides marmoriginsengisoli TaxID=661483 RepID=A0A3N0C954_9ACTN|nr:cytochrome P450 [Nocardioides marmoriginsengisoli]RNL59980.1 cytochrome P450 [Nocardioides marmoriginsengisoli]